MSNLTNGTLDTRLKQELTQKFEIPCNIEYDRFSSFKIAGGNGIWLVHCPSGVKAYYATENNYDKKIPLNQENRGMKYAEIGNEGITKLYDNFYIFTEGTSADDKLVIIVSSQESAVEPILGNASGNISQLDTLGGFSQNAINQMTRAVLGGISSQTTKFSKQIEIIGDFTFSPDYNAQGLKLYHFPLGKDSTIKALGLKNDALYRIRQVGHFDIGQARMEGNGVDLWDYKTANKIKKTYQTNKYGYDWVSFVVFKDTYKNVCNITFDLINKTMNVNAKVNVDSYSLIEYFNLSMDINETIPFSSVIDKTNSKNEVYQNTNDYTTQAKPSIEMIFIDRPVAQKNKVATLSAPEPELPMPGDRAYLTLDVDLTPIWNVVKHTQSVATTDFYDIWESSHLSIIKEVDSPNYIDVPSGISSNFSNLYTSLTQPYYKKFDLWGQKTRHANKDSIVNYEGTGLNLNSNDLVISGAILNQYDKFMIGWNVTNLYNPDLKLTASAANCHSSIILEITEL